MSSAELGLDYPKIKASDSSDLVKITSLIGKGATSTVYAGNFRGRNGIVKILEPSFSNLADHEANALNHLKQNGVPRAPLDCMKVNDKILFFSEELTHVTMMDRN
mmetsp:Transcript_17411/g.26439  ORF Transcript_17411/g.26439 Transcript_17411/m.26439 type:complete len:105 (-) Transcript_17411:735-1049(-)